MRRIIFYTLSFVFLSITMSGCQCQTYVPVSPLYKVVFENHSELDISCLKVWNHVDEEIKWETYKTLPTQVNPVIIAGHYKSTYSIILLNGELSVIDTTITLDVIADNASDVWVYLVLNQDGTITVKEVPSVDPVSPKKTIHF